MVCPNCGYVMSDLDTECPRCSRARQTPPVYPSAPQPAASSPARARRASRIHFQRRSRSGIRGAPPALAGVVCLLAVASLAAFWVGVVNPRQQAEAKGLSAVAARLRTLYPDRHFAVIEGFGTRTRMSASLRELRVDSVTLSKTGSDRVEATVEYTGTTAVPVAPVVYVSLFDEDGRELGRYGVVEHLSADLSPRETDSTSDTIPISAGKEPVIVAVDDDHVARWLTQQQAQQQVAERQRQEAADWARSDRCRASFVDRLNAFEAGGPLVVAVARSRHSPDELILYVGAPWHFMPKQMRLQAAQAYWLIWAKIYSPQDLDKAKITLKDQMGNNVGGSSWLAGSIVKVPD